MYPLACIDSFNIPLTYLQTQVMDYDGLKFNLRSAGDLVNYVYIMLLHTERAGSRMIPWMNGQRVGTIEQIAKLDRLSTFVGRSFFAFAMPC